MAAPEAPFGMICRGHKCDRPADCQSAGRCLYRPSADEAREVMAQFGKCGKSTCPKGCSSAAPAETIAVTQIVRSALPNGSSARKNVPLARGVLDYFPAALAAVAELSRAGNEKHNPGQDLHWARGKSTDHADCIMRHLMDRGQIDPEDNISHTVKVAWRALALLQEELEAAGAPTARGAR